MMRDEYADISIPGDAAVRDRPSVSPGQSVSLKIDVKKAHLFEPVRGNRLP
ncbi:hypothetical protein [Rhizobium sp. SG741]|uniref:hypothetical protein n=1 Tax=Rhizobium sp. SG741 TaxID=2587114 RepID=UPI00181046F7|nr:hypothetical protein [Rhizobium sp. SG741]NKJ08825.1 hypothetical protein [Rhizobium sp. SG741]